MNKITTDEQFIEELGRKTGLGIIIADYYWFGGSLDPKWASVFGIEQSELEKWIKDQVDYRGDPDNVDEYFQHLYDYVGLSWEALNYIGNGLNLPEDKTFMCIWGDGYVEYNGKALIECHGSPFFDKDMGFSEEQIHQVTHLSFGGCVEIRGMMEVMSVVRVS